MFTRQSSARLNGRRSKASLAPRYAAPLRSASHRPAAPLTASLAPQQGETRMILRPYQQQAVEAAEERLAGHGRTLIVMPTGTGKTLVFSELIRRKLSWGRCMVVAHREELLEQARDKIQTIIGERPDLEMADNYASEGLYSARVVVSSVQTQTAGRDGKLRMHRFNPMDFALLVADESHHAVADTWKAVIAHYGSNPALSVLGVTATPDRTDEKALGQVFDSVAFNYELTDAIAEGWLVPVKQKYLSVEVDLGGVRMTLGDFNGADLRAALARGDTLERIASDAIQWAGDRRTLVFADSVENAERLTVDFNRHRHGSAAIVTGETPRDERKRVIADYRAGHLPSGPCKRSGGRRMSSTLWRVRSDSITNSYTKRQPGVISSR